MYFFCLVNIYVPVDNVKESSSNQYLKEAVCRGGVYERQLVTCIYLVLGE